MSSQLSNSATLVILGKYLQSTRFASVVIAISFTFSTYLIDAASAFGQEQKSESASEVETGKDAGPLQTTQRPIGSSARRYTPVYPLDAVSDSQGNVWVVDLNASAVWKIESNQSPRILIQGEKKYRQRLNTPRCIALSAANELYVGDTATREVYRVKESGEIEPTVAGQIGIPMDLAFNSVGDLFIADLERRAIWRLRSGESKAAIFIQGANARGLYVDKDDQLWVVSQNPQQLVRYDSEANATVLVDHRIFEFPHQIVVDKNGVAWISDGYKKCIWKIEPGGKPEVAITSDLFENPVGMLIIKDQIAVVDPHASAIFRIDESGKVEKWISISK